MATYVMLIQFTAKGIENIKDSPNRLDIAKQAFAAAGAEFKDFYLTMGRYDVVAVGEASDDETVAKLALTLGSAGAIRTETLRAFDEDEYRSIIAALP
jgi:uncharacterized protein with GYD domain